MSTLQIVAIAVAAGLIVLLIIALLVTRRRGTSATPEQATPPPDAPSFIDERLHDSFAGLGKAEQSVEDVTLDPVTDDFADSAADAAGSADLQDESEVTGEMPAVQAILRDRQVSPLTTSGAVATAPPVCEPVAGGSVPLSDVIVTTSCKLVDLGDPDVRRTLTDLVKLEVDQAIEFRRLGQTVDAVMQLTEAEKISHALGLHESAQRIREMIEEMNRLA
jgi:hypothetical protein